MLPSQKTIVTVLGRIPAQPGGGRKTRLSHIYNEGFKPVKTPKNAHHDDAYTQCCHAVRLHDSPVLSRVLLKLRKINLIGWWPTGRGIKDATK